MEVYVHHSKQPVNSDDSYRSTSPLPIHWKGILELEMERAWLVTAVAIRILDITPEELFQQLPKQTERLKNWFPLSGKRRNEEDEHLKQEVLDCIKDIQTSIQTIETWKKNLTTKSDLIGQAQNKVILEQLEEIRSGVHTFYAKAVNCNTDPDVQKNALLARLTRRINSDNAKAPSTETVRLVVRIHDTTQLQFEGQLKTFHSNTEDLSGKKMSLTLQLQLFQTALSTFKNQYNVLYEKVTPNQLTGLTYYLSATPDHLNTGIAKPLDSSKMSEEHSDIESTETEARELEEVKENIKNSYVYRCLTTNAPEGFHDFFVSLLDKLGYSVETFVGNKDYDKIKQKVLHWEKMPTLLKRATDLALKKEGEDFIKEMKETVEPFNMHYNVMLNDLSSSHVSVKINSLHQYQNDFKNSSDKKIRYFWEKNANITKRLQNHIDDVYTVKISQFSEELIGNAFDDIGYEMIKNQISSFHVLSNELKQLKTNVIEKYKAICNDMQNFKTLWDAKLRETIPCLATPENSKKSFIDFKSIYDLPEVDALIQSNTTSYHYTEIESDWDGDHVGEEFITFDDPLDKESI